MARGRSVVFARFGGVRRTPPLAAWRLRVPGFLLVALTVLAVGASTATGALPEQFLVAGPGGWVSTYASQAVAVEAGGALTFLNADVMYHNVVSVVPGPDTQPWCTLYLPTRPCPLLWSVTTGGFGETTPVLGLENLEPGTVYSFYCEPHPGMTGRLVALPSFGGV